MNEVATRAAPWTSAPMWALGFTYTLAWAIAGWLWTGPLNDLDYFLLPSARIALSGHLLLVYSVRFHSIVANDNGPLGFLPITPVAALASQLGWLDDERLRRMLILAAFSVFTLLMAREAVAAIDRLRGASLEGLSRVLGYGIFVASPTLWISVLGYGHVEQPMMLWLILLGMRKLASGRPNAAGFSLGLAMLTRPLAALPLIPLGLLLAARGRWRTFTGFVGSAALTVSLGFLPFLIGDPKNTVYSLLTHRGSLPVGGGSVWQLVVGTPFEWIPQRADILLVLAVAALTSLVVIRARRDLEPSSPDVYGLLVLPALALPLLAKSVWPYYFLDAYVFGAIWWLGQAGALVWRRRLLGVTLLVVATIGTLLTEYEVGSTVTQIRLPEGVVVGLVLAILAAALTGRLRHVPEDRLTGAT